MGSWGQRLAERFRRGQAPSLSQILGLQREIVQSLTRMEKQMSVSQADLDAKLDTIAATAAQLGTDIQAVIAAIEAKVPPAIDLSAEFAKAQAIAEQLQGIDTDTLAAKSA